MTSPRPVISTVMPVRNCGQWLRPAVDSILDQSFEDFELIIVDDNTTDGSVQSLPSDPRIRILRHDASGIVSSLNHGLLNAKGRFIARMDGDDICFPERFATQVAYLDANPDIDIVGGLVEIFSDEFEVADGSRYYQDWLNSVLSEADIDREIFVESPLVHPSVLIRKSLFRQIGLYRDLSWPEDYDLWLRAWLAGARIAKVDEPVIRWREHAQRLTRTDDRYSKKEFIKAKGWAMSESVLKDRSAIICGTGKAAVKLCDVLLQLGVPVLGFVDIAPNKINKTRRNLPIHSFEDINKIRGNSLLVGALGARGAGDQLRELLVTNELTEGQDFIIAS